jgi:hypothetical protein
MKNIRKLAKSYLPKPILSTLSRFGVGVVDLEKYAFDKSLDIKKDIQEKYGYDGDLLDIFVNNKDHMVQKWHHYIPLYDRHFSRFRGKKVRLLEIGVCRGGSLQIWRKYFGSGAIIYGIDIDPECARFDGVAAEVRIGSQDDHDFLGSIIAEMGGVDLIIDDGSHHMHHICSSLNFLFPLLSNGGIYMIEDLHTAYSRGYGGGYRSKSNWTLLSTRREPATW